MSRTRRGRRAKKRRAFYGESIKAPDCNTLQNTIGLDDVNMNPGLLSESWGLGF